MLYLSDNKQTVFVKVVYYTSRYLDDLFNINNPYFDKSDISHRTSVRFSKLF